MFEFAATAEKAQIHLRHRQLHFLDKRSIPQTNRSITDNPQTLSENHTLLENHVELSELGAALPEDGGVGE